MRSNPTKSGADTSFQALKINLLQQPRQARTLTDFLVEAFTPVMIFLMVVSFIMFLLDIRYVYTAVHNANLRFVSVCFVIGIVALNRLVVRDGKDESFLYIAGLMGAVALYTMSMDWYDVGSVARGFMSGPWSTLFNMGVVGFIWFLTNRLTHECCVDENPYAGDVGLLTGTARSFRKAIAEARDPKRKTESVFVKKKKRDSSIVYNVIEAYDPTEDYKPRTAAPSKVAIEVKRPPKRHPGISIFYFSAPVMLAFALGERVLVHGGPPMILAGHCYVGLYTLSALLLLMLSSLGGLREFFRAKRTRIPGGIGPFWIGLGLVQAIIVMVGALSVPLPPAPKPVFIDRHETDYWTRTDPFQPIEVVTTSAELVQQYRIMHYISLAVLACIGLVFAYGALRALGALALLVARRHTRLPAFVVRFFDRLDKAIERYLRLPALPAFERRPRIKREYSLAAKFVNPMQRAGVAPGAAIQESYAALCALAADLGVPRAEGQTPYEFIESFPKALRTLQDEARELTHLYVAAAYSEATFDPRTLDRVRKFWQAYEKVRGRVIR